MNKLYYSISEVSELLDEEQHILRYWEKEFPQLNPKKNRGGNRVYSTKDIALIKAIKKLLRDDKLSLKGAKEQIEKIAESPDLEKLYPEDSFVLKHSSSPGDENLRKYVKLSTDDINELRELLFEIRDFLV